MDSQEQSTRLAALRAEMKAGNLAVFIIPRADEHQGEYVAPCDERLKWVTGFSGSAGIALAGSRRAAIFVDGRYVVQAGKEVDSQLWEHRHLLDAPPQSWLADIIVAGDKVGFDPRLHTKDGLTEIRSAVERAGATLCPVAMNPIDTIWADRPPAPMAPVEIYPESLAGESSRSKRHRIAEGLRTQKVDACIISALDNLAWLFNLRGSDLAVAPLVLGFAILRADETAALFIEPHKLDDAVRASLEEEGTGAVSLRSLDGFSDALRALAGCRVRVDRLTGSVYVGDTLKESGATPDIGDDPCTLTKASKTAAELAGMRAAHLRDGVALVRFLAWFAKNGPGDETEWTLATRLSALRSEGQHYRGVSFHTISAFGPNSAIPHYRTEEHTALPIHSDQIYLIDSGAQYLDGTTDVTRTVILGTPTTEARRRYTQVLKGHIALASTRFPAGTTGTQLDSLARQFLWREGVDFDHGTGHGVGCYLSVHEGPQGISKRPNTVALSPGMIVSDEPGYYKSGHFGIRIENLVAVRVLEPQPDGAEKTTLEFETLTLAPYDRNLIDAGSLTPEERAWVDAYHARVREALTTYLDADTSAFLAAVTSPV